MNECKVQSEVRLRQKDREKERLAVVESSNLTITERYVKGKEVPLQARSGAESYRKLRFPDFVTKAQDGGKVVSLTHRPPLLPGNAPGTHFC